jgi:hypothetical protein
LAEHRERLRALADAWSEHATRLSVLEGMVRRKPALAGAAVRDIADEERRSLAVLEVAIRGELGVRG